MAQNVADFFWMRLHEWGVRCVFGYPGDGINGLLGGLQRLGEDKIRFIQVRHEEMAAFMASAYAKFTGRLGVCIATSGPGASHLITGLFDARLDHVPVLAGEERGFRRRDSGGGGRGEGSTNREFDSRGGVIAGTLIREVVGAGLCAPRMR